MQSSARALEIADHLRIRIIGFYHAHVGPEWSTFGRAEGDYLQHINMVVGGNARIIQPSGPLEYEPGKVYWSPGNTPVVRECDDFFETYFLTFRFEWLGGFDPFMEWPGRRHLRIGTWKGILDPAEWDFQRGLTIRAAWGLRAQIAAWLADSLVEMEDVLSVHQKNAERFRPVLEYFEKNIGSDLRIEDLAQIIGLNGRAFSMAFTRALKITPKAYLSRRLNQEAIRLVTHSRFNMREIADQLRFSDEYHFNRFFKKMNGQPPLRYRARQAIRLSTCDRE